MTQKIIKVGSSMAVTIPKKSNKEFGFEIGDEVNVHINPLKKEMTVTPAKGKDEELIQWTTAFIKKHKKLLKSLADK